MIVATRPEPTVRPPSRFNKYIFRRVFGAFYAIFHGNNMFITHYLFITLISWHRFGTGILFRQTVRPIGIYQILFTGCSSIYPLVPIGSN